MSFQKNDNEVKNYFVENNNISMEDLENKQVLIETNNVASFKRIFETVNKVLDNGELIFNFNHQQKDQTKLFTGISLSGCNSYKTAYFNMKLDYSEENFNIFYCSKSEVKIGLNFLEIGKIFKSIENSEIFKIQILKNEPNKIYFIFTNGTLTTCYNTTSINITSNSSIDMAAIYPDVEFVITTNSFSSLCKSIELSSARICINCTENNLILSSSGEGNNNNIEIILNKPILKNQENVNKSNKESFTKNKKNLKKDDNNYITYKKDDVSNSLLEYSMKNPNLKIVSACFNSSALVLYSKFNGLSPTITVYMTNTNKILIIEYFLSKLGKIRILIASVDDNTDEDDEINNNANSESENEEEDEY